MTWMNELHEWVMTIHMFLGIVIVMMYPAEENFCLALLLKSQGAVT